MHSKLYTNLCRSSFQYAEVRRKNVNLLSKVYANDGINLKTQALVCTLHYLLADSEAI